MFQAQELHLLRESVHNLHTLSEEVMRTTLQIAVTCSSLALSGHNDSSAVTALQGDRAFEIIFCLSVLMQTLTTA